MIVDKDLTNMMRWGKHEQDQMLHVNRLINQRYCAYVLAVCIGIGFWGVVILLLSKSI